MAPDPDYSLYLVTDSTEAILGKRDLVDVVEQAIQGGVTIVQYRDKSSETVDLVRTATRLHQVTKRNRVPLLINDRLDVAIAVGAEGVHLGQEDMDIKSARKALGKDAVIGATASSVKEALKAAEDGADYIGLGTVFSTATKENTKSIVGTTGLRRMLDSLSTLPANIKKPATVCIGGINANNIQRVLYQSRPAPPNHQRHALDGVAVVSAIIAAQDPSSAAAQLRRLAVTPPPFANFFLATVAAKPTLDEMLAFAPKLHQALASTKPLSHNMTNTVVQNMAANVALAIGASPIMSQNPAEAADLAAIPGAGLVINMGTATADSLAAYSAALAAYNAAGRPALLDPVGAGATALRRDATRQLLNAGYFSLIKGNEAEIRTVWAQGTGAHALGGAPDTDADSAPIAQRGVDSGSAALDARAAASLVRALALRERTTVLLTDATDYLSDGVRTVAVRNGHALLGEVTGSGCSLGAVLASFIAADGAEESQQQQRSNRDTLRAALAGLLVYEIAAERAVAGGAVRGPGSFVPALLDALYALREESRAGEFGWVAQARVEDVVDLQ